MSRTYTPKNKELTHYGVKGMKWGVRNDSETSKHRFQAGETIVDSALHQSSQTAGKEIASLIGKRYNFHISEIKAIGPGHREYDMGTAGYVEVNNKSGKSNRVIYVSQDDLRGVMKNAEETGWTAKDCGTVSSFLTHESAHAIFHAPQQQVKTGFLKSKTVGGNIEARDKAITAAIQQAAKDGIPGHKFTSVISGYSKSSGTREEAEAEMFSQYHWSSNPPKFVKVWGETLHQELGIDGTPFRESR